MFPKNFNKIVASVLKIWPEHSKFLDRGVHELSEDELYDVEAIAEAIVTIIAHEADAYSSDYKTMCGNINDEEYFFRRNDSYRFSTYDEVADFVYHNKSYMKTYMRGLLISQVLWTNHIGVMDYYRNGFLSGFRSPVQRHVEIGPGHGLFMHLALASGNFHHCEGWDISASSIEETQENLTILGHDSSTFDVFNRNALDISNHTDGIGALTISEVLEHTENPQEVLNSIHRGLAPGAKIFVNIPLNCPAIDHIYLYREADEIIDQVKSAGFKVVGNREFPVTGFTLERAHKMKATISVAVIAERY